MGHGAWGLEETVGGRDCGMEGGSEGVKEMPKITNA